MTYADSTFPEDADVFPSRQTVLQYLQDYGKPYEELIRFSSEVLSLRKNAPNSDWQLTFQLDNIVRNERFDRVIIATGHYETPYEPSIPGLVDFRDTHPGRVLHAKYYDLPTTYAGKRVLLIGGGPSGIDIATQLSRIAGCRVFLSTRSPVSFTFNNNVEFVSEVNSIERDGTITLCDGKMLRQIDSLILCTGYRYAFPFLRLGCTSAQQIITTGLSINNLYKQLLYRHDSTLAIMAQQTSIVPFPLAQAQACFLSRFWNGRIEIPASALRASTELPSKEGCRASMKLGHPADGIYIESLRLACQQADDETGQQSMLPPAWQGRRSWLRENTAALKVLHSLC